MLITDDGRGALCDFGLSKVVEDLGRPTGLTLSNPDVGPIRWQPPEFLEDIDEPATLTSDVWSYGCTAFEVGVLFYFILFFEALGTRKSDLTFFLSQAPYKSHTLSSPHQRRSSDQGHAKRNQTFRTHLY